MRLKEDNSSWKAGGIIKRDNRHDKSLPANETTHAPSTTNKKKAKHVHTIKATQIGERMAYPHFRKPDGTLYRKQMMRPYYSFSCSCGWKRSGFSATICKSGYISVSQYS